MPRVIDTFRGKYYFLSNFYSPAPVVLLGDGKPWTFPTSENAYQALKSATPSVHWPLFADPTVSPMKAKYKGQRIPCRVGWREHLRRPMMRAVLWDKFTRSPHLGDWLLATGDALLVEGNSWGDTFWGVCDGVGENALGLELMATREALRLLRG